MAFIDGTIVSGTEVLVEQIQIWIEVFSGPGHLKSWSGSFTLPQEHNFSFTTDRECEVQLVDGRKGTIIPNHFDGSIVSFQGSGPLK